VFRVGRVRAAGLLVLGMTAGGIVLSAVSAQRPASLPEPRRGFGASVTPAFEGWFYNPDGSRSFLIGYYNRNSQQEVDVPIGPNNRIEPGGPDLGQPTHFLAGRQWGIFILPVPKDFKPTDFFTWTIVANGQSMSIPFRLNADYVMSPFAEIAVGNTPPAIRFEPAGTAFQGPLANLATAPAKATSVATPLPIDVFVSDDMKFTTGTSAPVVVTGDRAALKHAFAEVMLNALQANPADPRIGVRLQPESGTNGRGGLQIEVQDNGTGFTPETAEKAPAPFYTTRNVGLGLGLTVSRKIIETHHGRLEIMPPASGGAGIVRISLPLDAAPP